MRRLIESLERTGRLIEAAVADLDDEQARWKPASGAWSILEIINHLADEEAEDFRTRLGLTLEDPAQPWPGIDPEGAAVERKYNQRELRESLARFVEARGASMQWLRGLGDVDEIDWKAAKTHPLAGELRAGDLLASWAAHDLLHLRQIIKRRFEWLTAQAEPYQTDYAGKW